MAEDDGLGYWGVLAIVAGVLVGDLLVYSLLSFSLKDRLPPWIPITLFWCAGQ